MSLALVGEYGHRLEHRTFDYHERRYSVHEIRKALLDVG
jgi:hypothetical protein